MAYLYLARLMIFKIINSHENIQKNKRKSPIDLKRNNKLQAHINKISTPKNSIPGLEASNYLLQYIIKSNDDLLHKQFCDISYLFDKKCKKLKDLLVISAEERIEIVRSIIYDHQRRDMKKVYIKYFENLLKTFSKLEYMNTISDNHRLRKDYEYIYDSYFSTSKKHEDIFSLVNSCKEDVRKLVLDAAKKYFDRLTIFEQDFQIRFTNPEQYTSFLNNMSQIYLNCTSMEDLQYIFYKISSNGNLIPNISLSHFYDKTLVDVASIETPKEFDETSDLGYIFSDLIEKIKENDKNSELTIDKILWNTLSATLFDWTINTNVMSQLTMKATIKAIQKSAIILHFGILNIIFKHATIAEDLYDRLLIEMSLMEESNPKYIIYQEIYKKLGSFLKK